MYVYCCDIVESWSQPLSMQTSSIGHSCFRNTWLHNQKNGIIRLHQSPRLGYSFPSAPICRRGLSTTVSASVFDYCPSASRKSIYVQISNMSVT